MLFSLVNCVWIPGVDADVMLNQILICFVPFPWDRNSYYLDVLQANGIVLLNISHQFHMTPSLSQSCIIKCTLYFQEVLKIFIPKWKQQIQRYSVCLNFSECYRYVHNYVNIYILWSWGCEVFKYDRGSVLNKQCLRCNTLKWLPILNCGMK